MTSERDRDQMSLPVARTEALWPLGIGGLAMVFLRLYPIPPPANFLVCGFYWLTARPCPLCGMTRALACLAKGDWVRGIHFNALSPVVFAILLATTGLAAFQLLAPEFSYPSISAVSRGNGWMACLILFVIYGVLRIFSLMP